MPLKKSIFFISFIFLSPSFGLSAEKFDLKSAVNYALEHSLELKSARSQIDIAGFEKQNSFSSFLPKATFESYHGIERQTPAPDSGDNFWASQFNLKVAETLYDNGKSLTGYEVSKLKKDLEEIKHIETRDKLVLDVVGAFYDYSLNQALFDVTKKNYELIELQYNIVKNNYSQGIKSEKDFLRFKAQLSQAYLQLAAAETAIKESQNKLKLLLGADASSEISFTPIQPDPIKQSYDIAPPELSKHFVTKKNDLEQKIEDRNIDFIKKKIYPELTLSSNLTYGASDYMGTGDSINANDQFRWNVLLGVNYQLWDFGTTKREILIEREKGQIQENSRQKSVLSTQSEIENLILVLNTQKANYKLTVDLLEMFEKSYNVLESDYKRGKISYLDLKTGISDLLGARSGFLKSHFDLLTNFARLKYHRGEIYDSVLKG